MLATSSDPPAACSEEFRVAKGCGAQQAGFDLPPQLRACFHVEKEAGADDDLVAGVFLALPVGFVALGFGYPGV